MVVDGETCSEVPVTLGSGVVNRRQEAHLHSHQDAGSVVHQIDGQVIHRADNIILKIRDSAVV